MPGGTADPVAAHAPCQAAMGEEQASSHLPSSPPSYALLLLGSRGANAAGTAVPYTQLKWGRAHPVGGQACQGALRQQDAVEARLLHWGLMPLRTVKPC